MNYKLLFSLLTLVLSVKCVAQSDTLIINNEKILCTVKEITADGVRYSYPNEELTNTVYKNAVQKIIFKSGRIQTFAEATSFRKVTTVDEYENVTLTAVESEVKGLFKLGDVSSTAQGGTELSNPERVKQRAYRKMKIKAAMMGANIIYLTNQRSEGNKYGVWVSTAAETSLTGVAYTNQTPKLEEFKKLLNDRIEFSAIEQYSLESSASDVLKLKVKNRFKVTNIMDDNGIITIEGQFSGNKKQSKFRLAYFSNETFSIYVERKNASYSYTIRFDPPATRRNRRIASN